jgi:hypothetical protein
MDGRTNDCNRLRTVKEITDVGNKTEVGKGGWWSVSEGEAVHLARANSRGRMARVLIWPKRACAPIYSYTRGGWRDIGSSCVMTFTRMADFPILERENVTPTAEMIGGEVGCFHILRSQPCFWALRLSKRPCAFARYERSSLPSHMYDF